MRKTKSALQKKFLINMINFFINKKNKVVMSIGLYAGNKQYCDIYEKLITKATWARKFDVINYPSGIGVED